MDHFIAGADADGDGSISFEELFAVIQSVGIEGQRGSERTSPSVKTKWSAAWSLCPNQQQPVGNEAIIWHKMRELAETLF